MDNTLNEIKQQWQLLQDKLESQSIVNDKLIRRIINSNARSINRRALLVTVMAARAIPYCTWLLLWLRISLAFTIVTAVFLLAAVCYNIYTPPRAACPTCSKQFGRSDMPRGTHENALCPMAALQHSIHYMLVRVVCIRNHDPCRHEPRRTHGHTRGWRCGWRNWCCFGHIHLPPHPALGQ